VFKASLKAPPKGIFTEFPHPNFTSLWSLMEQLNHVYEEDSRRAPTIFFINEGVHACVNGNDDEADNDNDLPVTYPMQIIGAGRDKTFIQGGGFDIRGEKEEGKNVVLKNMTISGTKYNGVFAFNGLSFLCDSLTITQCGYHGVCLQRNTKGRLINCVVTQCRRSGIWCGEIALIELEGDQTKVDGTVTSGGYNNYGLTTFHTSSRIHLLFPLTKESISTNNVTELNHNGQNYGGNGTIQTVNTFETSTSP
jgi:hypothetical protein